MIDWKTLNSVVFETMNLSKIREFYEVLLELEIAQYEKDGKEIEDVTDRHVNYENGGQDTKKDNKFIHFIFGWMFFLS